MGSFSALRYIKKTRRDCSCCWCGEMIFKASTAWKMTGNHDGKFFADYLHPECLEANQRLTSAERDELCDGWEDGEFQRGMTPRESRLTIKASNEDNQRVEQTKE